MTPGAAADYTIRPFETIQDFRECVELQEDTWGRGFSERVSLAILKVSQILGGVASGAYDADGTLVGFVFGMTGVRDGELAHWSDMLAVRPEARDSGLGRRLKAYQREVMLEQGVEKMYWTFDPLRSRNAHLNLTRLGAVVREYRVDMYGAETDSPLHRGIGTDRFVALWLLSSERVRTRIAAWAGGSAGPVDGEGPGSPGPAEAVGLASAPFALEAVEGTPHPTPGEPRLDLGNDAVRVAIPSDIGGLMAADTDLAVRWRHATRAVFRHYIAEGLEVREFERGERSSTYVLARRGEGGEGQ